MEVRRRKWLAMKRERAPLVPEDVKDAWRSWECIDLEGLFDPLTQFLLLKKLLKRSSTGNTPVRECSAFPECSAVEAQARAYDQEVLCEFPRAA